MPVIQSRKKLKMAVCMMLILRLNVVAEEMLTCKVGIIVGDGDGSFSQPCPANFSCLRVEIDEIEATNGDKGQFSSFSVVLLKFLRVS